MRKKLLILLSIAALVGFGIAVTLVGSPTPLRADPPPPAAPP
jgi:hypothetical protein